MNADSTKKLVMITRICGLLAFALGCAYASGHKVPLACHILVGATVVLALLSLAARGYRHAPLRALAGITVALLTPVAGLAQDAPSIAAGPMRGYFVLCHMILAISAIAFAEMLAKAIRLQSATI